MKQGLTAKEAARLLEQLRHDVLAGDEKAFRENAYKLDTLLMWQPEREGFSETVVSGLLRLFEMPALHSFSELGCLFSAALDSELVQVLTEEDATRLLAGLVRWIPSFESRLAAEERLVWMYPDKRGLDALTQLRQTEKRGVLVFLPDTLELFIQLCEDRAVQEGALALLGGLSDHADDYVACAAAHYHKRAVEYLEG